MAYTCENQVFVEGLFILVFEKIRPYKKNLTYHHFLHPMGNYKIHNCAVKCASFYLGKIAVQFFFPFILFEWSSLFANVCHVRKHRKMKKHLNDLKMA